MTTIDQLKPEQLRDPDVFEKIKELADPFILHMDGKEALFLQKKLEPLLETSKTADLQPELYKKYQDLIVQLKWIAFPLLPSEEVLDTLQKSYLMSLENEYINTDDRIEAKMFSMDLFPRNEIRQEMQRALKENGERLGEQTFGEWLLDYSRAFDFRDRDEFTPSKYVRENPKAQALSETEKNKLRKALQIFDRTLLVTPVMSEPAFSMTVRAMIKAGTIKERVNPALLQRFTPAVKTTSPAPKETPVVNIEPKPAPKPIVMPAPPPPEIYEKQISPYEKKREMSSVKEILTTPEEIKIPEAKHEAEEKQSYKIRTMKQDIERVKRRPIPPKPKPKIKDNVVDLSGK